MRRESIILRRNLITNVNLHFFIVRGFRGCKRTEEKRKFYHSFASFNNRNDNLNLNNNNNNANDCKSSITIKLFLK